MNLRSRLVPVLIVAIATISGIGFAQQEDDGILSCPPRLRVVGTTQSQVRGFIETKELSRPFSLVPLPIIFFGEAGSTTITSRYQRFGATSETESYADTNFVWNWKGPLAKYYELLNIIGYRMRENPEAAITLEGGYSSESGESREVALARAEAIRHYLRTIWEIPEERIAIAEPRQMCSSTAPPFLQQEARCVVVRTEAPEIFSEISYINRSRSMPMADIEIDLETFVRPEELAAIRIDMYLGDSLFCSADLPPVSGADSYHLRDLWTIFPELLLRADGRMTYTASVKTQDGRIRSSNPVSLPIHTVDITTGGPDYPSSSESLFIPAFGYREERLSRYQGQLIERYIRKKGSRKAPITIIGESDPSEYSERINGWSLSYNPDRDVFAPIDPLANIRLFPDDVKKEGSDHMAKYIRIFSFFTCGTVDRVPTDSLLARKRAGAVARYITEKFADYSVTTDAVPSSGENTYFPEERYYQRGVTVQVASGESDSSSGSE